MEIVSNIQKCCTPTHTHNRTSIETIFGLMYISFFRKLNLFVLKNTGGTLKLGNRKGIKQKCFEISTQIKKIVSFRIV